MDPKQTNLSSSTPATTGGMVPIAQLEQLLRLLQQNIDLTQTLATLAAPTQTAVVPLHTEAKVVPITVSTPILNEEEVYSGATEVVGEGGETKADLVDDVGSGPSTGGIEQRVEAEAVQVERIEVVREDIEWVKGAIERTEVATNVERVEIDSDRIKQDMAEIEAEIREGKGPMVEAEASGVEARAKARVEEDVMLVSDSEVGEPEVVERERTQREEADKSSLLLAEGEGC